MREVGPVRFRYVGDIPSCMQYHNEGRKVLGKLKERMKLGGIGGGWYQEEVDDYTLIKAESLMGQDIVTIERYAVEEGGEEDDYDPYLWVGVRIDSAAADVSLPEWSPIPFTILNVFEPPLSQSEIDNQSRRLQFVSNRGQFLPVLGKDAYPAGDENTCYTITEFSSEWFLGGEPQCDALNAFTLANIFGPSEQRFNGQYYKVVHTDRNLYCIGHPFAWDPEYVEGADNEEDKIWDEVAILDPADPTKRWEQSFKGRYGGEYYGPLTQGVLPNVEWRLPGKILPGKYAIKVGMFNFTWCEKVPASLTLEVRLGKPPGRTLRQRWQFDLTDAGFFYHEQVPYGHWDLGHQVAENGEAGPNPHAENYWQDAVLVDVLGGVIEHVRADNDPNNRRLLTDPGYALHDGRDTPFIDTDRGLQIPACGFDVVCMASPVSETNLQYIDYRDHAVKGNPAWRKANGYEFAYTYFHLTWLKGVVVCVWADRPGLPYQVQITEDCGECDPLGYGNVIRATAWRGPNNDWTNEQSEKFSLGQEVIVVGLPAPIGSDLFIVATLSDFYAHLAQEDERKNLVCGSGRLNLLLDIEGAGYTVECVNGVETITGVPDWHNGGTP